MEDEVQSEGLSDDAKAYFESRGEKLPEPEKEKPDEEAQAEAEPEAEADEVLDPGEEGDKPKGDKTVPLRAVTKEREEHRKTKAQLQEVDKKLAILEDRWNTLLKAGEQQQKPVDDDPEPDPNEDIFAHSAWQARQLAKMNARLTERDQQETQAKQAQEVENRIWSEWHSSVAEAKADPETPDFSDAVTFLSDARVKQLSALGAAYPQFRTQAGINQQINAELREIVVNAKQAGMSPARAVYDLAKAWGYSGPKPKAEEDPAKVVEKLAKDIEAGKSLSDAGGSRPGAGLDAKAIADMSPAEFEAWFAKHGEAGFRKIASGRG